jgi:hypothetical protein
MKKIAFTYLAIAFVLQTGCKKFLAEEPKKQTSIQTVAQLEALVNNAQNFTDDADLTAIYSTDDCEISKALYQNNSARFGLDILQYYTFQVGGVANLSSDGHWNKMFQSIFSANLILANVDNVTGDEGAKNAVRADAHFIRAYSNWVLANQYCAPYSTANLNSPGLPLKKTTTYEESLERSTLKGTYDFIQSDLAEAAKVAKDDVDPKLPWRINQKTLNAFMSRFYLFIGDYDKSLEAANKALASATVRLVDFNTLAAGTPATYSNPATTLNYSELNDWGVAKFLFWPELFYTRYIYNSSQWFIPSSALIASFDQQNDLRYKYFMIADGSRRFSVITPSTYRYTVFYDGRDIPAGLTISEVLVNKAEALARKGDIANALSAVNTLRQKRMSTYISLTASSKDEVIAKVLEERRRELPFAMRWYDIRRFSVNDYPADDITVVRDFFETTPSSVNMNNPKTYTLENKRYLVPINSLEIMVSRGKITQNPY